MVEEAIWLLPIVVVLKKNGKLRLILGNSMQQQKKDPYLLFFKDEVINTVVGHEVYTLLQNVGAIH
jgi:hypothetical protein